MGLHQPLVGGHLVTGTVQTLTLPSFLDCYRLYCLTQTFQFGYNPTGRLVDPTGRGNNSHGNTYFSQSHCRRLCSDEQQPQAVRHTAGQAHHHRILQLW